MAQAQRVHAVGGRYILVRQLAVGGMAEVWLARQIGIAGFEKLVVLKRIHPHLANDTGFVRMFLDEARMAGDLRHANVVNVTDVGADAGTFFIVMEYLHGRDVSQIAQRLLWRGQRAPLGPLLQVIADAARGLEYAHSKLDLAGDPQEIIHRDVSPQNVFVTFDGGTKLLDFGIASAASRTTETETGIVKGKIGYMSPERVEGEQLDPRSDQFSLGIVLHELLTQRPLFDRPSQGETFRALGECKVVRPSALRLDIPPELDTLVMKALSRDPEDRFGSCGELADCLTGILEHRQLPHSAARVGQWLRDIFPEHSLPPTTEVYSGEPTRNERLVG